MSARICETTVSTGLGAMDLRVTAGASSFASHFATGGDNMFFYLIRHSLTAEWECGTAHLTDYTTLVRDTVISSSQQNTRIDFGEGLKTVTNLLLQ